MQTTKFHFVVGLMAALVAPALTCVARDTPEQIKAREALRQKMAELETSATNTTTAVASPQPVAPVAAPQKKAPVIPVTPVAAPAPVPVPAPATTVPTSSQFAPVPDAVESANNSALREALRQEIAVLDRTPAVATKPTKPGPTAVIAVPPVMEVPLSPLTGPKAARLAELLQRYTADQITPKEYHTQRAAILAEP
jgi:hypothetical protein